MTRMNSNFPLDLLSAGSKHTTLDKRGLDGIIKEIKKKIISTINKRLGGVEKIVTTVYQFHICFEIIVKIEIRPTMCQMALSLLPKALSSYGEVRGMVVKPFEKRTIALEILRPDRQNVRLREVLESKEFQESKAHLPVALGIDSENNAVTADLAKMDYLLIVGEPGQGKSVLLDNIILSLLSRLSPTDLKFVLIDPKQVEFTHFNKIKNHYLLQTGEMCPEVITEIEKVPTILNSIVYEVGYRYDLLRKAGCQTIYEYDQKFAEGKLSKVHYPHLPFILVVIDEIADLMNSIRCDFELSLVQIARLSQAVGVHVVIATQYLSSDIVTGIIKVTFPSRIAFKLTSIEDSETILDFTGAEYLLGKGDMLFNNFGSINRIQSCLIEADEIGNVCDWIKTNWNQPQPYRLPVAPIIDQKTIAGDFDPLFEEVARYVMECGEARASSLQRHFSIGFTRASILLYLLEAAGIVGKLKNGQREVLKQKGLKQ